MFKKLRSIFILLRPYSLPGLFLLYYLAKVINTSSLVLNFDYLIMFIPVLFAWVFLTLLLEAMHKHSNREHIPYSYPIIALIITFSFAVYFNGLLTLLPLLFFVFFTYLYTKKNANKIFGSISFIIRGFTEMILFFFALSIFSNNYLNTLNILLGSVIFLITTSRNLLGDVRDTKFDESTFSVVFGDKLSYVVSILLYCLASFILFILSGSLGIIFPIVLMIALLILIDDGYMFHRLSVLLSTIIISMYILILTGNSTLIILLNIIFLSILFNIVFYNLVPRKSNPLKTNIKFGLLYHDINNKKTKND